MKNGDGPGARIWQDVSQWAEMNVFIGAKRAGWLDAVRYYSSMSLRFMKAWSHWEDIDRRWRAAPPQHFPDYAQWQCEVAAVARLSNPDSIAQQVLDSVRGVSEAEWSRLLYGFSDLMAFCLWMELVLDSRVQPLGSFPRNWRRGTVASVPRWARWDPRKLFAPLRVGDRACTRDCRPETDARSFELSR